MSAHGASASDCTDAQGCDNPTPLPASGRGGRIFCPHPQPLSHPVGAYTNRRARVHKSTDKREPPPSGSPCEQGEPNPCAVPLAKRGEPKGGGQLMNFGRAIGIRGVGFFSRGWRGGRDARVPSAARAGSASVSLAWRQKRPARRLREQARLQKTYPFKPCGRGERFAESCGVLKRQLQRRAEAPLPHSTPPSPACRRGGQRANLLEC